MGCDISILSQHNLNLTSIETLANDLADRFGFNIDYGYFAFEEYNKPLENNLEEGFISLGKIEKQPFKRAYKLIDEIYQHKQLHEKLGDAMYDLGAYWHLNDSENIERGKRTEVQIADAKRELIFADYVLDCFGSGNESSYLYIHNEVVSQNFHYYTRWWQFCETIQKRDYFDDDDYQDFRKAIWQDTLILGGQIAYFVNDQCRHLEGVGGGDEMFYTWEELEKFIHSRATLEVVSISRTVLDQDYQNEVRDKKDTTLAFFDDFADLR